MKTTRTLRPFTKSIIGARKALGLSQEEAALRVCVSYRALQNYETEVNGVSSSLAAAMARAYHDPTICAVYCACECPIGQEKGMPECMRSMESLMLELLLHDDQDMLSGTVHDLYGAVTGDVDTRKAEECLRYLQTHANLADALRIAAQKRLEWAKERNR